MGVEQDQEIWKMRGPRDVLSLCVSFREGWCGIWDTTCKKDYPPLLSAGRCEGLQRFSLELPTKEVLPPSETFKIRLDGALSTCSTSKCPCSLQGSWIQWPLRVPSNSNDSVILRLSRSWQVSYLGCSPSAIQCCEAVLWCWCFRWEACLKLDGTCFWGMWPSGSYQLHDGSRTWLFLGAVQH